MLKVSLPLHYSLAELLHLDELTLYAPAFLFQSDFISAVYLSVCSAGSVILSSLTGIMCHLA